MSTELERVREKLYERASITLTDVFERLVREEQDKISREDERAKLKPFLNKQVLDERVGQTIDRFLARRER